MVNFISKTKIFILWNGRKPSWHLPPPRQTHQSEKNEKSKFWDLILWNRLPCTTFLGSGRSYLAAAPPANTPLWKLLSEVSLPVDKVEGWNIRADFELLMNVVDSCLKVLAYLPIVCIPKLFLSSKNQSWKRTDWLSAEVHFRSNIQRRSQHDSGRVALPEMVRHRAT